MQRVAHDSATYPQDVLAALDAKVELVRKHFPPSVANLFAKPRPGSDGALQWWSELGGQPTPYAQLDEQQQSRLLQIYQQRQDALGHLANALQGRGDAAAASALRSLIGPPDLHNLYSLNGDPVVVRWGLPALPPPAVAPSSAPAVVASAPARHWRRWLWLALLPLLLIGLLWLLWFWRGYLLHVFNPQPLVSYACQKDPSVAPDFVVVLDTSGSMNINIAASQADEQWFFQEGQHYDARHPRKAMLLSEPTRLAVAKNAFGGMIGSLHPDIDMRLITFAGCDRQVDQGVFAHAERQQLLAGLQNITANEGTPLAASLEKAASLVDGRRRDAVVVMFIDGEDGCERDVCAVSRRIAREQPRLRVNVVNIGESTLSNCIAENTGGRVYSASSEQEVSRILLQASEEVSSAAQCQ